MSIEINSIKERLANIEAEKQAIAAQEAQEAKRKAMFTSVLNSDDEARKSIIDTIKNIKTEVLMLRKKEKQLLETIEKCTPKKENSLHEFRHNSKGTKPRLRFGITKTYGNSETANTSNIEKIIEVLHMALEEMRTAIESKKATIKALHDGIYYAEVENL